ncbi:hypothetical protein F3J37_17770 [Pantoea sp. Al-1710]|uniref:Major tropism determinant N-terminal domain-containing protein n=1 Tax=Candidatus Pantoea communis TaxID=2608354 RepID=A0ABX0RSC5_9GAMM|nr:hypothetical protein [Pantoea communis]NIG20525.1 hypothetical protein [Pantoea communis]
MAASIQVKRGTTAKVAAYTPLSGELVLDTTTNKLYAGDGSTAGGNQIAASKKGVTDGGNATSGEVGEYLSNTGTASNATAGSVANYATLTLTPGDWDVSGCAQFNPTGASNNATQFNVSISLSSGMGGGFPYMTQLRSSFNANGGQMINTPVRRVSVSVSTIVYLVAGASFPDGTMPVQGFIQARRAR